MIGKPGLMICDKTTIARVSAFCCARLPAMVIGDVAPPMGQGSVANVIPASAILMTASASWSGIVSGLTGDSEKMSADDLRQ